MLASATLASVLLLFAISRAVAQESPPDPRMLLNLDLFAALGSDSDAAGPSDGQPESLVDQIRALRALGILGGQRKYGARLDQNRPAPNHYSSPAPPYADHSEPVE